MVLHWLEFKGEKERRVELRIYAIFLENDDGHRRSGRGNYRLANRKFFVSFPIQRMSCRGVRLLITLISKTA